MRLGVLPLGGAPLGVLETEILAPIRAMNIDVVTPEPDAPPIATGAGAAQAALRLQRADCDGVLVFVGRDADVAGESADVCAAQAALHLAATPLLLSGLPTEMFFKVAGGLEAIGVAFDRRFCARDFDLSELSEEISTWLTENRREQRQRGVEAARSLYGRRLFVPAPYPTPDVAQWMHQFGLIVGRHADGADFTADDGDALAALTGHLLTGLGGAEAIVRRTPVWGEFHDGGASENATATFARITARAGRYRCVIVRGQLGCDLPDGRSSVRRYLCADERLFAEASFAEFCAIEGNHVGALRAACLALDIEPVILR